MSLTIDFTPVEEARIRAAAKGEGTNPADLVRKLVTAHLPGSLTEESDDPALALLEMWNQEDALMTPEEDKNQEKLWKQFENNINAEWRSRGMRQL